MRTLIYARYSSHLQRAQSSADQIRGCRERCASEAWSVVDEFHDDAISGAAGVGDHQRPGMSALLARVARGDID